jgi:hypothetical protein
VSEKPLTDEGKVDRFAILTYLFAALWLFGLGSALALVVGLLSLRRIRSQPGLRGTTVAWSGIAVALVGIALAGLTLVVSLAA